MAYKKSETNQYVRISERDYLTLLEDSITLKALKLAGIEKMPIYQSIHSIIADGRVEIHIKPIKSRYR